MTDRSALTFGEGATVLVADDHAPNLLLMERILRGAGLADVHTTSDPREVPRLFQAVAPDIVLLDLHMPDLDGVEVMEQIRRSTPPDEFVPIVVLTADSTPAARERVLHAGANDFLTKPIDRTEVVLRVRNLLHTRALHERLRAHNAALRSEVETTRAEQERATAEAAAKRARIEHVIDADRIDIALQPIVDLQTGCAIGHEALSRFDHDPVRPPNEWFDDADDVGLGTELELVAVRRALDAAGAVAGRLLTINVSPTTAASPRLVELLASRAPATTAIEVTEHARVEDYQALAAALEPLRHAGTLLAVDDAGAGYASLSHILRLSPDLIKLDISLVRDIDRDPVKRALASCLVAFAREIGARIVAEGIETTSERDALTDLGVHWGQGYLLGRPRIGARHHQRAHDSQRRSR